MKGIKALYKAVVAPLEIFREYMQQGSLGLPLMIIGFTAALNAVVAPVVYYLTFKKEFVLVLNTTRLAAALVFCAVSFLAACGLFKLLSIVFRKPAGLRQIITTWSFSFIPTFLCVILVELSELGFYYFIGNTLLAVVVSTILILLFIWKAIFFFMELNVVLKLRDAETIVALIVTGGVYAVLIGIGFALGLKVPML